MFFFFLCNIKMICMSFFFFSSRRRHTRLQGDWSSDVCSSDLEALTKGVEPIGRWVLEGNVVHEGDRARADAEDIVHVHGDAIDTDRLQATHGLRDEQLRPDPV